MVEEIEVRLELDSQSFETDFHRVINTTKSQLQTITSEIKNIIDCVPKVAQLFGGFQAGVSGAQMMTAAFSELNAMFGSVMGAMGIFTSFVSLASIFNAAFKEVRGIESSFDRAKRTSLEIQASFQEIGRLAGEFSNQVSSATSVFEGILSKRGAGKGQRIFCSAL